MIEHLDNEIPKLPKEELRYFAHQLAEALDGKGNILRIGLFGSLSREEESPSDVDLAVLIDNERFKDFLHTKIFDGNPDLSFYRQAFEMWGMSDNDPKENFLFEHIMGLTRHEAKQVALILISFLNAAGELPDLTILPNTIEKEPLELELKYRQDPTFLSAIIKDYKQFTDGVFQPTPMYTEEELAVVQSAEFERLKYLSQHPNDVMYSLWEEDRAPEE